MSQEELAERAGVGVRTIGDLELGRRTRPYRHTVDSLAAALALRGPRLEEFVRLSRPGQVPDGGQAGSVESGGRALLELAGRPLGASAVPRQLPAAVSHFTGRMAELEILTGLLNEPGGSGAVVVSAISGTAGVGKTALAVRWAHQVADRFPDGQLYVNLRGYDLGQPMSASDALAGFLRSVGVPGQAIPADENERAARYRSLLAGQEMLVILDNAVSAEQVGRCFRVLRSCTVVVTSRDTLTGLVARDGAVPLDLDLLRPDDAVGLLRVLIGVRADCDPEAAARLAFQCCRLPLALRVAAELAASRQAVPLAKLTAELADQQQRLDLLDAGGDPRTAVRAVFSWSCRNLDDRTARTFRLLSLHPGPEFEPYAAAALTNTTLGQARRAIDVLARAHLSPGRGRAATPCMTCCVPMPANWPLPKVTAVRCGRR